MRRDKALALLKDLTGRKKITIKHLQVLSGYLNFLSRAMHAGRTFTRRIYSKFASLTQGKLKPHHHVKIDNELRFDCEVWRIFLENYRDIAVCRPMLDCEEMIVAEDLMFYSDAIANKRLGFGAVFNKHWLYSQWEPGYINTDLNEPSIEYLELYALTAALLTWGHLLKDMRIQVYCDNMAVVSMINNATSSCKNCMFLIRLIVLNNLVNNRWVFT